MSRHNDTQTDPLPIPALSGSYLPVRGNHLTGESPCYFLKKLDHHLSAHVSDPTLSVRKLLGLMSMSRTDLHRKMKEAVGMSATEYIRYYRLSKAARLMLEHPDWSLGEVAACVGFKNLGYFCRRFKEVAGVSPGRWG